MNVRSLNKHHKELVTYLSLLNMKFDCICLSEVWNYNVEFYRNIFQNYVSYFEQQREPILVALQFLLTVI